MPLPVCGSNLIISKTMIFVISNKKLSLDSRQNSLKMCKKLDHLEVKITLLLPTPRF